MADPALEHAPARHILLVEDNPDDAALTLRALRRTALTAEITWVRDGVEALNYLLRAGAYVSAAQPDLVVLDLKLPRLDGLEVLRRLRAHPPTRCLPVVMLTSSREQSDIQRSYAYGANSYLHKQVDFVKFTHTIELMKAYWLQLNEAAPKDTPPPT